LPSDHADGFDTGCDRSWLDLDTAYEHAVSIRIGEIEQPLAGRLDVEPESSDGIVRASEGAGFLHLAPERNGLRAEVFEHDHRRTAGELRGQRVVQLLADLRRSRLDKHDRARSRLPQRESNDR
jgi:hypothetical protein